MERSPRIVSISKSQTSLIDYREAGDYVPYKREAPEFYKQAKLLLSDNEVTLLVLWAIISPLAALAYLIWAKYERLRVLSLILFALGMVQFAVQWQGIYQLATKLLVQWQLI